MNSWIKKWLKILCFILIVWFLFFVTQLNQPFRFRESKTGVEDNEKYISIEPLQKLSATIGIHNESHYEFHAQDLIPDGSGFIEDSNKYTILAHPNEPPGENGKGVELKPDSEIKGNIRWSLKIGILKHDFNEFVSDLIPFNRTLPDYRDDSCKTQIMHPELPQISVVISFYNEAWSTLVRTIQSVISRTPDHLLKEIILVDDASALTHLMLNLEDFVKHATKVKLIRSEERLGIVRARVLGAKKATAPVLVFLDSHCEVTKGWAEPLLDRIARNSRTVAAPILDEIDKNTFEYKPQFLSDVRVGGFDWKMNFVWDRLPQNYNKKKSDPMRTPTISGGIFAIRKDFFALLGYYDEGFDIWGGENLEISFKVWMCGGVLEIVPCSRVGHVFRTIPYKKNKVSSTRNTVRIAEVWLDEYAKYYYETLGNKLGDFGNVENRKKLRRHLSCKSFSWYLKNVYPSMATPVELVARGSIINIDKEKMCFDAMELVNETRVLVILKKCHFKGGKQFWTYTKDGEIKQGQWCLDYVNKSVVLNYCIGRSKSQQWLYKPSLHHIYNMKNILCLTPLRNGKAWGLTLEKCSNASRQKWIMENYKIESLDPELQTLIINQPIRYHYEP